MEEVYHDRGEFWSLLYAQATTSEKDYFLLLVQDVELQQHTCLHAMLHHDDNGLNLRTQ